MTASRRPEPVPEVHYPIPDPLRENLPPAANFFLAGWHDEGQSFTAYVDNVRVLRNWEDYDDFSDNSLDADKWETAYFSGGQTPVAANGKIELKGGTYTGSNPSKFPS